MTMSLNEEHDLSDRSESARLEAEGRPQNNHKVPFLWGRTSVSAGPHAVRAFRRAVSPDGLLSPIAERKVGRDPNRLLAGSALNQRAIQRERQTSLPDACRRSERQDNYNEEHEGGEEAHLMIALRGCGGESF